MRQLIPKLRTTFHVLRSGNSRGMTIIEMLVWVAVSTFVMIALTSSLLYFYRTNSYTIQQSHAIASAQRGIDQMMRVTREITYSVNGAYPIVSIGASEFQFYADVDADAPAEKLRFFVNSTNLMRGVVEPTADMANPYTGAEEQSVLSEYVRNLLQSVTTFRYYDENGAEITNYANIADVRFVTVNIVVNVDPNKLPNELTLRSSAALRNLK